MGDAWEDVRPIRVGRFGGIDRGYWGYGKDTREGSVGVYGPNGCSWNYARNRSDNSVMRVQRQLNKRLAQIRPDGYNIPDLVVDGVLGTKSFGAIRACQHSWGVRDDGIVGSDTWSKLAAL